VENERNDIGELTRILQAAGLGDESAMQRAIELVYEDLERVARAQLSRARGPAIDGKTLEPRALVHETFLRLIQQRNAFENRGHFFAVATKVMLRAMREEERAKRALKRGGDALRVTLHDLPAEHGPTTATLTDVAAALDALEKLDARKAAIVRMKIFFGLTTTEIAEQLDSSERTIERDWRFARSWLAARLGR